MLCESELRSFRLVLIPPWAELFASRRAPDGSTPQRLLAAPGSCRRPFRLSCSTFYRGGRRALLGRADEAGKQTLEVETCDARLLIGIEPSTAPIQPVSSDSGSRASRILPLLMRPGWERCGQMDLIFYCCVCSSSESSLRAPDQFMGKLHAEALNPGQSAVCC